MLTNSAPALKKTHDKIQIANFILENTLSSLIKMLKIRRYTVWAKSVVFYVQEDDANCQNCALKPYILTEIILTKSPKRNSHILK